MGEYEAKKSDDTLKTEDENKLSEIEGILNDTTTQEDHLKQQFETMDPKEMLEHFSETLSNNPVQSLKGTIDALTKAFEKKMTALRASQRQIFINEGGNPDAFYFNPQVLKDFNNLIKNISYFVAIRWIKNFSWYPSSFCSVWH